MEILLSSEKKRAHETGERKTYFVELVHISEKERRNVEIGLERGLLVPCFKKAEESKCSALSKRTVSQLAH